jgi:hypothetical protein
MMKKHQHQLKGRPVKLKPHVYVPEEPVEFHAHEAAGYHRGEGRGAGNPTKY